MFGQLFDLSAEALPAGPPAVGAPAPPASSSQPDLQGLEFLAGGTWVASSMGSTYEETVILTLSGWFLTSVATSTPPSGPAVTTNGMLGGNNPTGLLQMWAFRSDGSVAQLTQVKAQQGDPITPPSWTFTGLSRGQQIRQVVIQTGPDSMETTTSTFVQGKWQAYPPMPYTRTP